MPLVSEQLVRRLNRMLYSRRLLVFLAVAGAMLTTLVAVALHRLESRAVQEALLGEAHDRAHFLGRELESSVEALYALAEVVRYVAPLDPAVFEDVANAALERNPGVLALEWLPGVSASELPRFERRLRDYHPAYRVTMVRPEGGRAPASARSRYFPVAYVVPYEGNLAVLGVDFYSSPVRKETLDRAWTTGGLAASPPLRLLQLAAEERGLLLVLPVFRGRPDTAAERREALRGFVVAAIDMKEMMRSVFAPDRYGRRYLEVEDVSRPDSPLLLHRSGARRPDGIRSVALAPIGGRVLRITLAPPPAPRIAMVLPWLVTFAGGLMTVGVCAYLWLLQRRGEVVSARVEEQTRELRQMNFQLATLSVTDPLTGLANRRAFDDYLEQEWSRAMREGTCLSLLLIDVDHFKRVNDTHGHQAGDLVLRELARRLQAAFKRPADRVARFGGEEFVVVMPNTRDGAETQANRFREAMAAEPIGVGPDQEISITVSGGLGSVVPAGHLTPRDLLKRADEVLYQAKRSGRNRIRVASPLEPDRPETGPEAPA